MASDMIHVPKTPPRYKLHQTIMCKKTGIIGCIWIDPDSNYNTRGWAYIAKRIDNLGYVCINEEDAEEFKLPSKQLTHE